MDFAFELILHRLSGKDMCNTFSSCKKFWNISKKKYFWANLMRRDFPWHHSLCNGNYEAWYKDLWKNGAYIWVDCGFSLYPEIPRLYYTCFMIDPTGYSICKNNYLIGLSYRFRESAILRNPEQKYIVVTTSTKLEKEEHKRLRYRKDSTAQGAIIFRHLMFVFSKEIPKFDFCTVEISGFHAENVPRMVRWIHTYFDISKIFIAKDKISIEFEGCLKLGNVLSYVKKELIKFETCGESGGRTWLGNPCNAKPLDSWLTQYQGRCKSHPRKPVENDIFKHSVVRYENVGKIDRFYLKEFGLLPSDSGLTIIYSHMNGEKINF